MVGRSFATAMLVALFIGCGRLHESTKDVVETGWIPRAEFEKPALSPFKARYDTVALEQDLVGMIRNANVGVNTLVFFGSWCGDSRREVPHFLKIADSCGWDSSRYHLYGLDRSKKSPDGLTEKYRIEKVPTFIFLKGDDEVGRITEKPAGTLEADMLAILASVKQK